MQQTVVKETLLVNGSQTKRRVHQLNRNRPCASKSLAHSHGSYMSLKLAEYCDYRGGGLDVKVVISKRSNVATCTCIS